MRIDNCIVDRGNNFKNNKSDNNDDGGEKHFFVLFIDKYGAMVSRIILCVKRGMLW